MMLMMFLSLLIHGIGCYKQQDNNHSSTSSLETEANLICAREFENKTLIWPEKTTDTTHHVESRAWYKDENFVSLIYENIFRKGPGYQDRLKHVGDGNIEIKNVTRNDSGNYKRISKFRGVNHPLDAFVNLQVIDAPARDCKPVISHEGSNLKAYLPSVEVCTTSQLRLEWIGTNKTFTTQNGTTILDLRTDCGEREYMVCAVGEARKCFQGNMSDFCTNYTVPHHQQSGDGVTLHLTVGIPITLLVIAIFAISGIFWMRHKGIICPKSSRKMDGEQKLGFPLIPKSDLSKIRDYLQNHYRRMTDVSVSPVGDRSVSVSEVYVSMKLEGIETRDTEDTKTDLLGATQCNSLVSKEDAVNLMTQNKLFPPFIMIIGDRGSGKSTLCKQLVHCWSLGDTEMNDLNLPLKNFKILLYLPLKNSDEGLSFQALLKQSLFPKQLSYLEFVSNYMNGQNLSQSILIVIDGLDKISQNCRLKLISELLVSKLSSCTVIFTSRPSSFNQISDACTNKAMKLYKICEMTPETSTTYVNSVLNIINQQNDTKLNPVRFMTFTKYLHVERLLTSPYHCLSLLYVWMENKSPDIQMIDIIFIILKNLLNQYKYIKSCNQNIHKRLNLFINRLLHKPSDINCFVDSVSEIAVEIFISEMKTLTGVEDLCHENVTQGSNMLESASELGLITESPFLDTKEDRSKRTFTNTLIYQYLVAYSIALKKGPAFDYIVSGLDIALENSLIIHMISQFSPARGKEIFDKLSKQKEKHNERHDELNIKYLIKRTRKRQSAKGKEVSVCWLQNLMYESKLDDKMLLFVTDALTFTDSLRVLELKSLDNNEDLIFWLPFSKTLKVLQLNISKCTLLLCPEWKNEKPINLKEVIIESMSIDESTQRVLVNALGTCSQLTKQILPRATITNIYEILLPRLDHTTNSLNIKSTHKV